MSPTIFIVPESLPRKSSEGSSAGTSLATGRPFLVITTGSRVDWTSSMTLRHRALNCPAGIVFMTTPDDYGHYSMTIAIRIMLDPREMGVGETQGRTES